MSYEVSISEANSCIVVRVTAEISEETAKRFSQEAVKASQKYGIQRFLIDVRGAASRMSTTQNYQFTYQHLSQIAFPRSSKIAILVGSSDTSHDFIETAAVNAGYTCRLFQEENAAVDWLEE